MNLDRERLMNRSFLLAVPGLWTVIFLFGGLGALSPQSLTGFGNHQQPWLLKCLLQVWGHRSLGGLVWDLLWWFALAKYFMQVDGTRTKLRVLSTGVLGSSAGVLIGNLVAPDAPGAGGWLFVVTVLASVSTVSRGRPRFDHKTLRVDRIATPGPLVVVYGVVTYAAMALVVLMPGGPPSIAGAMVAQAVAFTVGLVHGLCERAAQARADRVV